MDELNTLSSKSTSVSEITLSLRLGEIVAITTKITAISFAAMFFAYRKSHGQFCWESAGPNCMNVGSKIGKLVTTARVARNWRFFCVLRELIFTIRPILFFLPGIFCDFGKVPSTVSIDNIFVFVEYVKYTYPVIHRSLYTVLFLNEWASSNWTDTVVLLFRLANLN